MLISFATSLVPSFCVLFIYFKITSKNFFFLKTWTNSYILHEFRNATHPFVCSFGTDGALVAIFPRFWPCSDFWSSPATINSCLTSRNYNRFMLSHLQIKQINVMTSRNYKGSMLQLQTTTDSRYYI